MAESKVQKVAKKQASKVASETCKLCGGEVLWAKVGKHMKKVCFGCCEGV